MTALMQTKLPGAILTKVDRMSMATGLEVRPPLLDRHVVDFSLRLPLDLKIRRGVGKHLLREVARPLLPAGVFTHRKHGFSLPLSDWLNTRFWELLDDLYAPGTAASALFDRRAVQRTIADGRSAHRKAAKRSDYAASARAWQLAMVARWMDRFGVAA
ncbi:MAG: asparagine synthase-related protein [Pirellulales bacterium]